MKDRTRTRGAGAVLSVVSAIVLTMMFVANGARADEVQTVPLHNNTAPSGECPDDTSQSYWHFVIHPNDGTYTFVSITLAYTGGGTDTFTGAQIIRNGTQQDNVFVAVPAGHTLTDLALLGSSAQVSPSTGSPGFNLSHACPATTTTTTSTTTSTSTPDTTSPGETTAPAPTTAPSESTAPGETTPTPTADTTLVVVGPPTPPSTATTTFTPSVPDAPVGLPATGTDSAAASWFGGALLVLGLTMIVMARRRAGRPS